MIVGFVLLVVIDPTAYCLSAWQPHQDNHLLIAVIQRRRKVDAEGDSSTGCWRAACIVVVYHAWMFPEHLVHCVEYSIETFIN
uniref:Secreted protein n=1 Tax=Oryza punctata TaxID=4537 RepID=A0A0E0LBN8_ORYPU